MKEQLSSTRYKFAKLFKVHQTFVVLTAVLLLLIGVVLRINSLNNLPLDQNYLNAESSKIQSVNFNEEAIEQIKALNDSNVSDPGTQLPGGRQNPFNE